jgi:DNA invertase Pin-like site-specific DNA recombinase
MTINVVGYIRCSTIEQKESGLGLEAQQQRIEAEAERRDWNVTWMIDDGYTAANLDRPAIQQSLLSLRRHEYEALVVAKLDRLSRSLLDFAGLMERAQKEKWNVVCLDLGIDLSTPQGQLMANVMASFAAYEREIIRQRTRDALAALKARGVRLGRPISLPHKTRDIIARWYTSGAGVTAIAEALNEHGVATARNGLKWYPSTVRGVLRSLSLDEMTVAPEPTR